MSNEPSAHHDDHRDTDRTQPDVLDATSDHELVPPPNDTARWARSRASNPQMPDGTSHVGASTDGGSADTTAPRVATPIGTSRVAAFLVGLIALATLGRGTLDMVASASPAQEPVPIEVDAFNYAFNPEIIEVDASTNVSLTLTSTNGFHDMVLELDGDRVIATERVNTGQSTTVEFVTPDEPGDYYFYCSVGNHEALGMFGYLRVRAPASPTPELSATPTDAPTATPTATMAATVTPSATSTPQPPPDIFLPLLRNDP